MSEPPGLKYPHEKVLTGIGLLLLFPRKGETKRLFGVSPRLNLIVTIAPQTVTLDLVEPDPDGWTVVRMSADEARSVKQVLDGSKTRQFHTIESVPSKWGRFFGSQPETATVVSDMVSVCTRKDGRRFVTGPHNRGFQYPNSQRIELSLIEEADLVELLTKLLGPEVL